MSIAQVDIAITMNSQYISYGCLHLAQTPTCAAYNADAKSLGQFVANRCLRGFINMSGIDTIFEPVRVCAQNPNHLEDCPQLD